MKKETTAELARDRETTDLLLDTAERLFGEFGYDGVGMRTLAEEAKVNLGAATYHFGSKEALYIETFMRRFRPNNAERLRLLAEAEAEAKGQPLQIEKIAECLVRPPYLLGLAHPNFQALMARNIFMPPPFLHAAIHQEFEPHMEVFIKALCRSLPDVPEELIRLRTLFAMGSLLMLSMHMGKTPHALPALDQKFDEDLLKELVRFVAAGFQSAPVRKV